MGTDDGAQLEDGLAPLLFKPKLRQALPSVKMPGALNPQVRDPVLHVFRRHGGENVDEENNRYHRGNEEEFAGKHEDDDKQKYDCADVRKVFAVALLKQPRR